MLRWLVERSLRFKPIIIAIAVAIIALGFIQLKTMPIDTLPEFAPPYIEVQTEAPGLSVSEVEELVTFNLEELLNGTPWLDSIRSTSVSGLSSVILTFKPGTDLMRARQLVSERLGLVYALPNVAQPPVILQPMSATSRVTMVGLSSQKISLIDLSVLAHWEIRPALLSIPGVANVAIWGLRDKQMQVLVNPATLQLNNIKLDQIIGTTGNALWVSPLSFLNASTPGSGGWIESPQQRIEVAHTLPITTPKDLVKIVVENSTHTLGQVAKIVEGHPPLIGDAVLNNGNAGLLIVIDKFPGANTLEVTRNVEAKLKELQPGLNGIQIDTTLFRPASFVENAMDNTLYAFGSVILVFIITLFIFTFSWRKVLLCMCTIPVALMLTIILLHFCKQTLNIMVLLGLLIAMIAMMDDAMTTEFSAQHMTDAAIKFGYTTVFALSISILLFIPVFLLQGLTKAFFEPIIITLILALLSSFLISFTLLPVVASLLWKNQCQPFKKTNIRVHVEKTYERSMQWLAKKLNTQTIVFIAMMGGIITLVGLTFVVSQKTLTSIPDFKESNIIIKWEGPPGTSITEMVRVIKLLDQELTKMPGVLNIAAHIGRTALGDQIVNVNAAEIILNINTEEDYDKTLTKITALVQSYPGIFHIVETYLKQKIRQASIGGNSDALIRVFGPHLDVLRAKAGEIQQNLRKIPNIMDVEVEQQVEEPQIAVEVDLTKAQKYGLKPGDIRRTAATYMASIDAGTLFQDQKTFQVTVWGTPNVRHSIESLRNLLIDTPAGTWVKLSDVANVSIIPTPNFIKHEAVSRRMDISFNVKDHYYKEVYNDVNKMLTHIKFPLEFRAKLITAEEASSYSHVNYWLLTLFFIAIVVFLLLQSALNSFTLATMIFFSLPLALLGSLIAICFMPFISIASLFGMLVVIIIAIRHVLAIMVRYQSHLLSEYQLPFTTMISFMVISISLLPIFIYFDASGLEIIIPMIVVMLCGFITTAIFCLFIMPFLYLHVIHGRKSDAA